MRSLHEAAKRALLVLLNDARPLRVVGAELQRATPKGAGHL
jgi:hypothetical protein